MASEPLEARLENSCEEGASSSSLSETIRGVVAPLTSVATGAATASELLEPRLENSCDEGAASSSSLSDMDRMEISSSALLGLTARRDQAGPVSQLAIWRRPSATYA